jgi:tRNA (guanine37-N1)-methyltransferase
MKISILTLFPEMFQGPFSESIIKKAQEKNLVTIEFINIRDFGIGPHKMVDDTPYGGGVGMVMRVDVLHKAISSAVDGEIPKNQRKIILMSASGTPFKQQMANSFSKLQQLIIICGHYEGVDQRIEKYIDEEVSVGDFVTTGGEIPAMLITDAVTRRLPGVLKDEATLLESFQGVESAEKASLLEHPHYTKPAVYEDSPVPQVLISGNHKLIKDWREEMAQELTKTRRPDLT